MLAVFIQGGGSMENIKVSVIIPIYNMEPYLAQCLKSVINQTLQEIEIICVDDGSTDGSWEILRAFAAQDARIQVYTQANAGVSAARNLGMSHASGEYFAFLDSDDYYLPEAMEKAYAKAKKDDADICLYGEISLTEIDGRIVESCYSPNPKMLPEIVPYNINTCPERILNFGIPSVRDKLYRRSLLEENALQFPPLKLGEDQYVNTLALCLANGITALCKPLRYYRAFRGGSATSTVYNKAYDNLDNLLMSAEVLRERGAFPERSFANMALHSILWTILSIRCSWPAYDAFFNRLKNGDAQKLGLTMREPGYFYNPWEEEALTHFWRETPEVFLLYLLSITERRRMETAVQKNEQARRFKEKEVKLKKEVGCLKDSKSYRIGRAITWLPRKVRGAIRCNKEHGLCYTMRRTCEHLTGKTRNSRRILHKEEQKYKHLFAKKKEIIKLLRIHLLLDYNIMSETQTLNTIIEKKCSIARFGNGEFDLLLRKVGNSYQQSNEELIHDLRAVLSSANEKLLVCIPHSLIRTSGYTKEAADYWNQWVLRYGYQVQTLINSTVPRNYHFGDTQTTRPYIDWKEHSRAPRVFQRFKEIWRDKNIILAEGTHTRIGVGNDLLNDAKSVKRILCPAQNAYLSKSRIIEAIVSLHTDELVLLALGPTATILAYELTTMGIQALDIGHLDIEYEWFLSGANSKKAVPGKYVNEVPKGRDCTSECFDEVYLSQIVERIE